MAEGGSSRPGSLTDVIPPRLEPLLDDAAAPRQLADRFAAAGRSLYLVGGSVRDALLGRSDADTDLDFATDARPGRDPGASWLTSPPVSCSPGSGSARSGWCATVATTRSPRSAPRSTEADSRKPEVTFSDDIDTDLSRRDFTVNALAIRSGQRPRDGRSVRRPGRPRRRGAALPARRRDLVRRRPAADAAALPLRVDPRVHPFRRCRRGGGGDGVQDRGGGGRSGSRARSTSC